MQQHPISIHSGNTSIHNNPLAGGLIGTYLWLKITKAMTVYQTL